MTALDVVSSLLKLAIQLYQQIEGNKPDLDQLWKDAGAEIARIDTQQAADEAAERGYASQR
jgi:hypothetical protein